MSRPAAMYSRHSSIVLATAPMTGTDRVFELPDLRGQDLLRHVHALRGGGEARVLGDRHEITKVPHLNVHRGPNSNHRANPANGDKLGPGRHEAHE